MMKKWMTMVLAAVLLLATGCGNQQVQTPEETETIPLLTEAPETLLTETQAPETLTTETETPAEKEYPPFLTDAILIEGEPQRLDMELFDGGTYVVYIIQDMWDLETQVEDGYLVDRWVCSFNDMIDFRVISFGNLSEEEALSYIRNQKPNYRMDGEEPREIFGSDMQNRYFLNGILRSDGRNTFAILAEFPMEAGDGFLGRTAKMMDTFEIK